MRKIDAKFHIENDQIIKTTNGVVISEDEPLFLIRARDYLALPLLRYYAQISGADSCTDYHMSGIAKAIAEFEDFTVKHPEQMKQPGITRGL
jgi:hypothetical protein